MVCWFLLNRNCTPQLTHWLVAKGRFWALTNWIMEWLRHNKFSGQNHFLVARHASTYPVSLQVRTPQHEIFLCGSRIIRSHLVYWKKHQVATTSGRASNQFCFNIPSVKDGKRSISSPLNKHPIDQWLFCRANVTWMTMTWSIRNHILAPQTCWMNDSSGFWMLWSHVSWSGFFRIPRFLPSMLSRILMICFSNFLGIMIFHC